MLVASAASASAAVAAAAAAVAAAGGWSDLKKMRARPKTESVI